MFIAGLGVGPTFSVFTIVVQNAVPFSVLGVATSNLTFFRQIGGSVALAIVGTIFGTTFIEQVAPQMAKAGVPPEAQGAFGQAVASGQLDFNNLTGVGDLGAAILSAVDAGTRTVIEPFIGSIVTAMQEAFSLAVAQTFWIGVAAAIVSAIAAATMHEHALRTENVPVRAPQPGASKPVTTAD
jgi:hypothetical protein